MLPRAIRAAAAVLAAAAASLPAGPRAPARADPAADFSRYVAVGDGWTAGFMNGTLCDGGPERGGQRDAYPVLLAGAMGTPATLPLVAWPGRAGRAAFVRGEDACTFGIRPATVQVNTVAGGAGRIDPSVRATVVAVPLQRAGDALERTWTMDTVSLAPQTDADFVLGLPWAAEGAPPRSQVDTAVALGPTFVTVWLGIEDALDAARKGDASLLTPRRAFAAQIADVVGRLAGGGARGAIGTIPDVTRLPHFVPQRELRTLLTDEPTEADPHPKPPPSAGLTIVLGVGPASFLVRTKNAFRKIDEIHVGSGSAPLPGNLVLNGREVRRIRRAIRGYNRAIRAAAAAHGWAVAETGRLVDGWRRGVDVGGTRLTTRPFGGLFDLDDLTASLGGQNPSPTAHALLAAEFVRAIGAAYGTPLAPPDAAAVLARDPLAPCR